MIPFFFDTISYKSCKDKNSKQNVQQLDMQIELLQSVPHVHPNGQTLIRNEELEVNKTNEGYLVRFPSMNQIREAHMTADGRFVQVYVKGWDKEKAKEELFHAIRHFFYSCSETGLFCNSFSINFFIEIKYGFFQVILEWVKCTHYKSLGKNSLALKYHKWRFKFNWMEYW